MGESWCIIQNFQWTRNGIFYIWRQSHARLDCRDRTRAAKDLEKWETQSEKGRTLGLRGAQGARLRKEQTATQVQAGEQWESSWSSLEKSTKRSPELSGSSSWSSALGSARTPGANSEAQQWAESSKPGLVMGFFSLWKSQLTQDTIFMSRVDRVRSTDQKNPEKYINCGQWSLAVSSWRRSPWQAFKNKKCIADPFWLHRNRLENVLEVFSSSAFIKISAIE